MPAKARCHMLIQAVCARGAYARYSMLGRGIIMGRRGDIGIGLRDNRIEGLSWLAPASLVLATLALAVLLLSGCSGGSAQQSSASETATKSTVSLGERVEFGGLSFQIPEGWVAVDADNGGKYYYPSASDRTSLIHVVESDLQVSSGQESKVLGEILDGVLGSEGGTPEDLNTQNYTVDGYPAQRATYTGTINGVSYSMHFVSILHDGKVSMLMAGSPAAEAPYDAVFAECIDSIQVVQSAESSKSSASSNDSGAKVEKESGTEANGVINADKFAAISQGMSYEEVVGIIGSEGELVSSSSVAGIETSSYKWESNGWGVATIMFQDGVVVNKTQVGVGGSGGAKATMEAFNQVENGMSYEQVADIMGGEGELTSETEIAGITMSIYTWSGTSTFSSCQITFQNGEVSSKSQYGLE